LKIASDILSPEAIDEKNCFQPRQGFAFFSNMNKPDKFGIKYWLAACVLSNYLLKGVPYLGK